MKKDAIFIFLWGKKKKIMNNNNKWRRIFFLPW